jgi:hypothetical protein
MIEAFVARYVAAAMVKPVDGWLDFVAISVASERSADGGLIW